MKRSVLILAGGAGTRLWPLSTDDHPKQFLEIFGGKSLLQQTFARLAQLVPIEHIFVSTNGRYREKVVEQLPLLDPSNIILEPARRNTAPAIAICTAQIHQRLGETVIGVFPSDHHIGKPVAFVEAVNRGFAYAQTSEAIVTIGIQPTEPNTGFGYLELADAVSEGVLRTRRFVEKPDRARAEAFLEAGTFAWNGGMFLFRSSLFLELLAKTAPEIARLTSEFVAADTSKRDAIFAAMPSISIDFAIMEKAPEVVTVRGDFDWSDVGSWSAVARITESFAEGRVVRSDSDASFVHSTSGRPMVLIGADDFVIVESAHGMLIMKKDRSEELSNLAKALATSN